MDHFETTPDNNIYLYHKGNNPLIGDCLDPKFFGTSCLSTREKSRLPYSCIMYFTHVNDIPMDSVIQNKIGSIYRVEVDPKLIYPFNTDPNKYCNESSPVYIQLEKVQRQAKQDGYIGLVAKWLESFRVDIWEKINSPKLIDEI